MTREERIAAMIAYCERYVDLAIAGVQLPDNLVAEFIRALTDLYLLQDMK